MMHLYLSQSGIIQRVYDGTKNAAIANKDCVYFGEML